MVTIQGTDLFIKLVTDAGYPASRMESAEASPGERSARIMHHGAHRFPHFRCFSHVNVQGMSSRVGSGGATGVFSSQGRALDAEEKAGSTSLAWVSLLPADAAAPGPRAEQELLGE